MWSGASSAWAPASGGHTSTQLSRQPVNNTYQASGACDSATLGKYVLYAFSSGPTNAVNGTPSQVFIAVVDTSTNATIYQSAALDTASFSTAQSDFLSVKCVCLAGSQLAVLYLKGDGSAVMGVTVTISAGGMVSLGSPTGLTSNYSVGTVSGAFDVIQTTAGCAVLYPSTIGIIVSTFIISGGSWTQTHTAVVDASGSDYIGVMCLSQTSNGDLWVYYAYFVASTSGSVRYAVYSSTLGVVVAAKQVASLAAPYYVSNFTSVSNSATQQTIYWGIYAASSAFPTFVDQTNTATVNTSGTLG